MTESIQTTRRNFRIDRWLTNPPKPSGISEWHDGYFVRAVAIFQGCNISMDEAQAMLEGLQELYDV